MKKLKIILNSNIFLIFFIIITAIIVIYKINNIKYPIIKTPIVGTVINIKKESNRYVLTIKNKYKYLVYFYGNEDISLGDKVLIDGKINKFNNNTIPNLFNYKKYMLSNNIYYSIKCNKLTVFSKNKNILYKIKNNIIERINKISNYKYLYTFLLGDKSYIDENVYNTYKINGISHLFAISGMHITLLSSILLLILNKIKKKNINYIIVIIFLIFYLFLTNFTKSVIRSTMLFTFLFFNKILKINVKTYKVLIFIFCFNLIINSYNIYNTGFIFSYTISFYLIVFSSIINRHKNYFIKIFLTSFISFLVSIPILINNYYYINLMSIFNNIIFVPLVSLIIFPLSILLLIIPKFEFIYSIFVYVLENISIFISKFKLEIILCKMNYFAYIFYYLLISFVLYKIYKKKYCYILLMIITILIHSNYNNLIKKEFISFIDVGQGDSSIIYTQKETVLIDTGGNINYNISDNLINFFKSSGIKKINYLILTHGDYDHMGEAINLANNFKVEKVIFNCGEFNNLEKELIKVLNKKKIPYFSCIKELNIDNNKLYFLQTNIYDNENDNSNVIYTEIDGYKFMFMGDAGVDKEKDILQKYNISDIDVLKVGHHGSKTSSSEKFIEEMNPKYSVISVGKNNRYGHPNKEVLNTLSKSNIYRTDQDGSIMFKIKNNKFKIETCSP